MKSFFATATIIFLAFILSLFTNIGVTAQSINPTPKCGFACVDGSGNSSYTVPCGYNNCSAQGGAAAYCSSLGNGNTLQTLSCCQDRCAGDFFQSPPGCTEASGNPNYGCMLYKEKIACNNACSDGNSILVPTPSERDCTTMTPDYCGSPAKKCCADTMCNSTPVTWENTCTPVAGQYGQVDGIVYGTCGATETTCGDVIKITSSCISGTFATNYSGQYYCGNKPRGSTPSNSPSQNSFIGVNTPVTCTITQTGGASRVNSATYGSACGGTSSSATPVSFKVSCNSGQVGADNKAWRHTITHNSALGTISAEQATGNSEQVNYDLNFSIKYNDSGAGVEGTDNISIKICDGGANYQTPWANQAQYNLPEYCQTVNATIQVDTRPPYLGFDISIKDAKTIITTLTAQDTNLVSHSYFCTKVDFTKVSKDQFDKIYTPNSTTTCTGVDGNGASAQSFVDNPILMSQNVSSKDVRTIEYSFKDNVKNQIEPFRITYKDTTSGWKAVDSFCNSFVAASTIPPLGYQDLRNGKSLDVGSPWLQTKGGKVYSQNGVNYTINDIDADTCKVTDNSGNPLLTQIDGVQYKCPEANDDYTSTFHFTSLAATNSPRASKYGELFFQSKLGKITDIDKWTGGLNNTYYDYFKNNIEKNANFYKSSLRPGGTCDSSGYRKLYLISNSITLNGGGNIVSSILSNPAQRLINTAEGNIYQPLGSLTSCDSGNKAIFINGDLTINTPSSSWDVVENTVVLVSGDVIINGNIVKSTQNSSLLIISKGNVEILAGKYSSEGKTAEEYPGYDILDVGILSDAKITSYKDAPGPVWDGLLVNGFLIASGMCPNDRKSPLFTDGKISALVKVAHSGKCESKFGRDLLLLQNFIAPSESIVYDPAILVNLSDVIGHRPRFNIQEDYDPRL